MEVREGVAEKVDAGVWSLRVPIPGNPLGSTLVYVLDSDHGPVLVDAGWHHPDTWDALRRGVTEAGFDLTEVHGVLVTHHHPDHHGLAGRVRDVSGAWVAMHEADAAVVRRHREHLARSPGDRGIAEHAERAGLTDAEAGALAADFEAMIDIPPPAVPDVELRDGDIADVPGRLVRAVWTPGHSPGHTCFHLPDTAQLLSGDHLLPGITPHVGLHDWDDTADDPLGDFLMSLDRTAALHVREVLPAHQHRFTDVAARVAEIREHHDSRLEELLGALADGGRPTLWDLARVMSWNRSWDDLTPLMRRIATSEAAAHVRHLQTRGLAVAVDGDGPLRFRGVTQEDAEPATAVPG